MSKKADLELIEAYRREARSRRLSSTLKSSDLTPDPRTYVSDNVGTYHHRSESKRVAISSKDGKVTVVMGKSKPVMQSDKAKILGGSTVSVPEYKSLKRSIKDRS